MESASLHTEHLYAHAECIYTYAAYHKLIQTKCTGPANKNRLTLSKNKHNYTRSIHFQQGLTACIGFGQTMVYVGWSTLIGVTETCNTFLGLAPRCTLRGRRKSWEVKGQSIRVLSEKVECTHIYIPHWPSLFCFWERAKESPIESTWMCVLVEFKMHYTVVSSLNIDTLHWKFEIMNIETEITELKDKVTEHDLIVPVCIE